MNAFTQTNGTNTQLILMKKTLDTNQIQQTSDWSRLPDSQALTSSLLGSLVSHLAMLEKKKDYRIPEELFSMKLPEFSKTKDPDIFYSKMLKVYLVMTREKLSKQYLGFLPTWGIELNGKYLTAVSSGYLRTVKESSLSALIPKATRIPLRFLKRNQKNIKGDYSFTIDVGDTGGVMVGGIKRKLTNIEKEQLQGFPIGWTEGVPERERSKQLGNAVTVNVVEEIAKKLSHPKKEE